MSGVLSEEKGVGRAAVCPGCEDIHLGVGAVTLRLSKQDFLALADMLGRAARHPVLGPARQVRSLLSCGITSKEDKQDEQS